MNREDVSFASGGARCEAWLYRPESAVSDVACVVMAHGFSGTRGDGLPRYAERFAEAGLAALVFDYRHFGASEGEPRQLLDIGRQQADVEAAIAFARGIDGVDPQRIVLWGWSFGAGHAVAVGARDPRIAAVVAQAPFTDGPSAVRIMSPRNALRGTYEGVVDQLRAFAGRPASLIPAAGEPGTFALMTAPEAIPGFAAIGGGSWRNEVAARIMLSAPLYRPAASARRLACPLLVCACEHDQTTPPEPAKRMAMRAPRGELRSYPIGHFDIYLGEGFELAVADQADFLRRHGLTASAGRDRASAAVG